MGENKLFFDFEEEYDLVRVLENEPWLYNKHLVILERVVENVCISALPFQFSSFWVQLHDLPIHFLTREIRDLIGNSLGTLLHRTESKEESGKGNYLPVRVRIDISKPLIQVWKIWSNGKSILIGNYKWYM